MVTTHGRQRESTDGSVYKFGQHWQWIERFGRSNCKLAVAQRPGEDRLCREQIVCRGSWTIDGRIFGWSGDNREDQRRVPSHIIPSRIRA